jgi:Tfp pilus assembly protein PilF
MDMEKNNFAGELLLVLIAGLLLFGPVIFNHLVNKEIISIAYQADVCNNMIALSPKIKEKIKIIFDEQETKSVFFYNVKIENDGNKPINNLPIAITVDESVDISDLPEVATVPEVEFGEIKLDSENTSRNKIRYIISLFNPKDLVVFKFWGFSKKELTSDEPKIYAKIPNLKIHLKSEKPEKKGKPFHFIVLILGISSLISAGVGFVKKTTKQRLLKQVSKEEIAAEKREQENDILGAKKGLPKKSNEEGQTDQKGNEVKKIGEGKEDDLEKTDDDAVDAYLAKDEAEGDAIFDKLIDREKDPKEKLYLQARKLYLKTIALDIKYLEDVKKMALENSSEFWPTFYLGLGIYYQTKDYLSAETYLSKAKDIAPNVDKKVVCLTYISDCLVNLNKAKNGLQLLSEEYKNNSDLSDKQKSELLFKIGDINKDLGDLKKFFIEYEEALRLDPLNNGARFTLALAYSNNNYNKLAAYHYSQSCDFKKEKETAKENNNIALALSALGLPITSIKHFKKAIKLGNSKAVSNLASRLLKNGFIDEANEYLQKDVEEKKEKTDQRVHDVLSELETKKKNESEKLDNLKREADLQRRYYIKAFEYASDDDPKRLLGNWCINNINFTISLKDNKACGSYKKSDWESEEFEGEIIGKIVFFTWKEKRFASIKEYKGLLILVNDSRMEGYIDKSIDDIGMTSEIIGERVA